MHPRRAETRVVLFNKELKPVEIEQPHAEKLSLDTAQYFQYQTHPDTTDICIKDEFQ